MVTRSKPIRVLLVEDNPSDAVLVGDRLAESAIEFTVKLADSLSLALTRINESRVDVILLDLSLPDSSGLETFDQLQLAASDIPIVILSGHEDEELALQAVRKGAQDYLLKGAIDSGLLNRSIRYAIERARRQTVEKELRSAAEIQRRLIPKGRSKILGFDISGRCFPAEYVGGDYFDFFPMGSGKIGVVIGDAAGHGIAPAMTMSETRAVIRALATNSSDPGEILTRASRILAKDLTEQTFVTLFLACLDSKTNTLQFAAAGHHASVLDLRGRERKRLTTNDPPLGIQSHPYSTSKPISLSPRESLFLYTDGLIDCENSAGSRFGVYRLMETMTEFQNDDVVTTLTEMFQRVAQFVGATRRTDDLTAVLVRLQPDADVSKEGAAEADSQNSQSPTTTQHFTLTRQSNCHSIVLMDTNILTTDVCLDLQNGLFRYAQEESPAHFVVNFENVIRFSSEAINILLRLRNLLRENKKQIVLCCLSDELREAFKALNLENTVFNVFDDESSAIESLPK